MRGQVNSPFSVGIDILGGDIPSEQFMEPLFSSAQKLEGKARFVIFGTPSLFCSFPHPPSNVVYVSVKETITMEDPPLIAVRKKKDSSLYMAISHLKEGLIDGCISLGNTGALVAASQILLGSLPGISRPALAALLPLPNNKRMVVLDVGASFGSKENYFLELACMGIAYQKTLGKDCPRTALLNVGTEILKGTSSLQNTYRDLQSLSQRFPSLFTFIGNREGRDLFSGEIDVLVTDGFTGNVFLKTAEGIASSLMEQMAPLLHNPATLATLDRELNYKKHPGSLLCGVQGLVMKCHGNASPSHIVQSIDSVLQLLETKYLSKMKNNLSSMQQLGIV